MRFTKAQLLALGLMLTLAGTVPGQPIIVGFTESVKVSPAGLIENDDIRKEINLRPEQLTKVSEAMRVEEAKYQAAVEKLRGPDPLQTKNRMEALRRETVIETSRVLEKILEPEQWKRVCQINRQTRVPESLRDPDVVKELGLTEAQRKQLDELAFTYERDHARMVREAHGVVTTRTGPLGPKPPVSPVTLRKQYALKARLVLTPAQLSKWYDLLGPPYPAHR